MVVGHSGCPVFLHDFIYGFHMILFYFLSGYFFRDEKVVKDGRRYLFRKVRGLYWPYVKWSIFFIMLHNLFYNLGFNETLLSQQEMWINIKRSIRGLWQGEHFLGAYWFLISLFWEIVIFSIIVWIDNYFKFKNLKFILVLALFSFGLISMELKLDIWLKRELMILPFFYFGYLVGNDKSNVLDIRCCKELAYFCCFPVLLVMAIFIHIEVGLSIFGQYYGYIVTSFCGIYLIMIISSQLKETKFGLLFDKLGGVTLQIMTFHFLIFKVLTALLVYIFNLPSSLLREWPVPLSLEGYWILYSVVGIVVPYLMYLLYKLSKQRIFSIKTQQN